MSEKRSTSLVVIELLFVIAPDALLLDIAGPAEAFRLANLHRALQGLPPHFRLRFVGPEPAANSSVGLRLAGLEPLPEQLPTPTWIVLVGQPAVHATTASPAINTIAQWLNRVLYGRLGAQGCPHRLVTICSGTLLAARAGLLDNRRCTTHHELLPSLRVLAPKAQVVANRVYLMDGPLASSAGITAGIDLALQLIANACGEALAASIAQDMVVYLRRSGDDPELSPFLSHRRHMHPAVHHVQDAINAEPRRDWSMQTLAAVGNVTPRHLLRLFVEQAGVSPLLFLQTIRLERARQSLEHGANVTLAAESAGFRSGLHLRRAWKRRWGGSPRDLRSRALNTVIYCDGKFLTERLLSNEKSDDRAEINAFHASCYTKALTSSMHPANTMPRLATTRSYFFSDLDGIQFEWVHEPRLDPILGL